MFILAFVAAAAAFQAATPSRTLSATEAGQLAVQSLHSQAETRRRIKGWSNEQLQAELPRAVSGKTKLIFQAGHGVYAEYTAPDGNLRMWYPKNVNVVKGSWGVRVMRGKVRTCFSYRNAVNPVTQVYEPTECILPDQTLSAANVLQSWDGDVFHLMDDKIPYPKDALDIPSPQVG
jgi:hypothetical protein